MKTHLELQNNKKRFPVPVSLGSSKVDSCADQYLGPLKILF